MQCRQTWPAVALMLIGTACSAADLPVEIPAEFAARDTLDIGEESNEDARQCLQGLVWKPQAFAVRCEAGQSGRGDLLVRFPSPVASGDERNDSVSMEWYVARDEQRRPITAPAVVVVHESGRGMQVGQLFARGLRVQGLHAFLIHLPGYGERRSPDKRSRAENIVTAIQQAVADVRRARDAIAALPAVDSRHIALQGTSLGGFVSATAAGLDDGFDSVFIVLAGGQLYELIQSGEREAAEIREQLAAAGITGERLRTLALRIEPTRLAHRLNPKRTWLFSGKYDTVVPLKNALALSEAAKLDDEHHIQMTADHYSGIVFLPWVLPRIHGCIQQSLTADAVGE
ncbi:MAG: prolyl oligopeptidase family serine peptidase [Planctomycetales bacterium]|nr:prolyl oligopeptidase family serine peptidase [Planctomycetales bacterium]